MNCWLVQLFHDSPYNLHGFYPNIVGFGVKVRVEWFTRQEYLPPFH